MKEYLLRPFPDEDEVARFVAHCDAALERRLEEVAEELAGETGIRMIGLTGPTCSGKTTTARKLIECMEREGHRMHVISIDDFYYDTEYLHRLADADPEVEVDYDSEDTIDVELFAACFASLAAGNPTEMPHFSFEKGKRVKGETVTPQEGDVFLFEGIQILYPRIRAILEGEHYRSIYIMPQTSIRMGEELFEPEELRLMRRLVRDYRYRATNAEYTFYLWESVRRNEDLSIYPYAHLCNYSIDSTMPYEVGMLKPYLENILAEVGKESRYYATAVEILRQVKDVQPIPVEYISENSLYKEFI